MVDCSLSPSHRDELLTGVRQVFGDTLIDPELTNNRLESIDDSRYIEIEFMFTIGAQSWPRYSISESVILGISKSEKKLRIQRAVRGSRS